MSLISLYAHTGPLFLGEILNLLGVDDDDATGFTFSLEALLEETIGVD
jgi:hypothetical protein